MLRLASALVTALGLAAAAPAGAATIVINNGLAPPNPANVIDAANSHPSDDVRVQNLGCDLTVEDPCPMPWGDSTEVELVAGGSVGGFLQAFESSRITMRGGSVGSFLHAFLSSSVTISGGSVGTFLAGFDSAVVEIHGGSVGTVVAAFDTATVWIIGHDFAVDGAPVGFGPIAAASGVLTGTLDSGEPIDNLFCHAGSSACGGVATGSINLDRGRLVINNGLAPPNPANVIDAANSFPLDRVEVHNVGCPFPCALPWGDPTSVELVEGGSVALLWAFETSSITISGGSVASPVAVLDSASVRLSGGSVGSVLEALHSSRVTMSGGSVRSSLTAFGSSTVTMSGGSVGEFLFTADSSGVGLSGGSVGSSLRASNSSTVTMSGGSVAEDLEALDSSTVRIVGSGFAVDGTPVGLGPIEASSGLLTGTLESGEQIENRFCHRGSSICFGAAADGLITLVPEPGAALAAAVAVLSLAAVRARAPG